MVVSYLIDWKSILERINNLDDPVVLRLQLQILKKAVKQNGVLLSDRRGSVVHSLNRAIRKIEEICSDEQDEDPDILRFEDVKQILINFSNFYMDQGVFFDRPDESDNVDSFPEWLSEANRFFNDISLSHAPIPSVAITDQKLGNDILDNFTVSTLDAYDSSDIEQMRDDLLQAQCFHESNRSKFSSYLRCFAVSSSGIVTLLDPYFRRYLFRETKSYNSRGVESGRKAQLHSLVFLLTALVRNDNVEEIRIVSKVPTHETERDYFSESFLYTGDQRMKYYDLNAMTEKLAPICKGRQKDISIRVLFVSKGRESPARFHDRFMINDLFTLTFGAGLEVCTEDDKLKNAFNVSSCKTTDDNRNIFDAGRAQGYHFNRMDRNEFIDVAPRQRKFPHIHIKVGMEEL